MGGESRGSIAFSASYRPPTPLDIFSCPVPPSSTSDELHLTDGVSYNYNCRPIPPAALNALLKRPKLALEGGATVADVDAGRVSGFVFVSERDNGLETLHIALRFNTDKKVKVFSLADIYGAIEFGGTRLEDSCCFSGGYMENSRIVDHSLVYVSTKEPAQDRRSPWTVVYKTNLRTGKTERLTPKGVSDLSPAVSPSGKMVVVASFQGKGWDGEIEDLKTDIFTMNVEKRPLGRKLLIKDGGWPTWASDNVIFFHRKIGEMWGVFRFTISTKETVRVTPEEFDAVTPAAISETKVAVATIRQKSKFSDVRVEAQFRHIEIFDAAAPGQPPVQITQKTSPKCDHYNPFVLDGGGRVGYHRCRSDLLQHGNDVPRDFHKLESPVKDVGLFRVSGVFPTISKDGSKLAFVDNEFKAVWVADSQGLRSVFETKGADSIFSPMWNQNPGKDTLYVCMGPSFNASKPLEICAIPNVSSGARQRRQLTKGSFNNMSPSSSPDGNKFVFRSTRDGGEKKYKNLYIMEDAEVGEYGHGTVTRLTNGPWTDTHCQWSPNGDWIVFSSTRDKPRDVVELDNGLDPGYFAVFLVKASDPTVVIRVLKSGDDVGGHVNHPVFSPDGRSIAVTADLAAVSADPISLPLFLHSVRPYGDIFAVDIDTKDIRKNRDVKKFNRITHSRYEYAIPAWTVFATDDLNAKWKEMLSGGTVVENKPVGDEKPELDYEVHLYENNTKAFWRDRDTGGMCMSISARGLQIEWSTDSSYWEWGSNEKSIFPEVARLLNVCWFEAKGEMECSLPPGAYTFTWRLCLGSLYNWDREPVHFTLSKNDMDVQECKSFIDTTHSRGLPSRRIEPFRLPTIRGLDAGWTEYDVGEFVVQNGEKSCTLKFAMKAIHLLEWKSGVLLDGVVIRPTNTIRQ